MKKTLLLISGFMLPISTWAGVCSISTPPEVLTNYIRGVQSDITKATSAASKNLCTEFKDENKAVGNASTIMNRIMDGVDNELKLQDAFVVDFQYNIKTTFRGTSSQPLIQGQQNIHSLETQIIGAMRTAANNCSLDVAFPESTTTIQSRLKTLLIYNRKLEYYYKTVATGNPRIPDGIDTKDTTFAGIRSYYSPEMTSGCQDQYGFTEIIASFQSSIDSIVSGIKDGGAEWIKGRNMFRGQAGTYSEYQALQQKLLRQELSRQGLSESAQAQIMKNLSCFQRKTSENSTSDEMGNARDQCFQERDDHTANIVDYFVSGFQKDYKENGNNMDKYLANRVKLDTNISISTSIYSIWSEIDGTLGNVAETDTNAKILSDLISIHAQIVETNTLLQKKIPDMQRNCMKENPGIVGGCK